MVSRRSQNSGIKETGGQTINTAVS